MDDEYPNVERPTGFMEKVKKARKSLQLWCERDTLQLVEYTESLEDGIEALELIIGGHHKDGY